MMKTSTAGPQFVSGVVRLDVLCQIIELNISAGRHNLRFAIVFHVVGAKPRIFIANVHMAVRVKDFAGLALLIGLERRLAADGG